MTSAMGHSSICPMHCTNILGNFMIYDTAWGTWADKQEKQSSGKFGGQSALTFLEVSLKRKKCPLVAHYGLDS